MAVPKKKTSRSKRNQRRYSSAWVLSRENSIPCSNCGSPTRQHRVCDNCGHYASQQIYHPKAEDV